MEIKNVKCLHCGAQGYNPNVPKGHVIDTCSCESCQRDQSYAVGFIDGNTLNCSPSNLYWVAPEVYIKPMVDSVSLSEDEIEHNHLIATAKFHYFNGDFNALNKVLAVKEIAESPDAHYLMSKIYFNKLNNSARGLKYLKMAAESELPVAMAEYGYIIAKGLYGTPIRVQEGLDYLYHAAMDKEVLASSYLADIYLSGIYRDTDYQDLSEKEWYELIHLGVRTQDSHVNMVLGIFHHYGIGCEIDFDIAIDLFRQASIDGYVLGMGLLITILYERYMDSPDHAIKSEILMYGKYYLENANDKTCNEYLEVKKIYETLY